MAPDDMSQQEASNSFLTLNIKKLATFQKLAISMLLWMVVNAISLVCFFISFYQTGILQVNTISKKEMRMLQFGACRIRSSSIHCVLKYMLHTV